VQQSLSSKLFIDISKGKFIEVSKVSCNVHLLKFSIGPALSHIGSAMNLVKIILDIQICSISALHH
jgi:hypothetical protein